MSLRKPSPSGFSDCPKCGNSAPTTMPMINAIITLPNSEFRNLNTTVLLVVNSLYRDLSGNCSDWSDQCCDEE
jgi:hypothetical protein